MIHLNKWARLREKCWANIEPSVELTGLVLPGHLSECSGPDSIVTFNTTTKENPAGAVCSDSIERLITNAARVSTNAEIKNEKTLIRQLIKLGHHVPLEFITYQFMITGISKACSSQISRHRISSIVSASRRYQSQGVAFVYPLLEHVDDEDTARRIYMNLSEAYKDAYHSYLGLRDIGIKKGDCRYVIPVASATSKAWSINARSLRNFLRLRLDPTAESEIRRLAYMILAIAKQITPVVFEDFK